MARAPGLLLGLSAGGLVLPGADAGRAQAEHRTSSQATTAKGPFRKAPLNARCTAPQAAPAVGTATRRPHIAATVRVSEVSDTGDILMPRPRLHRGIQERLRLLTNSSARRVSAPSSRSTSRSAGTVSAARPTDRHDGVDHPGCRSRSRRPVRPADGANVQPNTRSVSRPSITSQRPKRMAFFRSTSPF